MLRLSHTVLLHFYDPQVTGLARLILPCSCIHLEGPHISKQCLIIEKSDLIKRYECKDRAATAPWLWRPLTSPCCYASRPLKADANLVALSKTRIIMCKPIREIFLLERRPGRASLPMLLHLFRRLTSPNLVWALQELHTESC